MSDQIDIKVSQDLVKPIIEAKIKAAIIQALDGEKKILEGILDAYMMQKVDERGKPGSGYNSDKPRIDWLLTSCIEDALRDAIKEHLSQNQEQFTQEFLKYFQSKRGSNLIVKAMQEGLLESMSSNWRFSIGLHLQGD
jgi:hypothetical protein